MSQAASGYDRMSGDRYYTPAWVVDALVDVEKFDARILDPAAGAGHIVDACLARGFDADGFDISPDAPTIKGPIDFLKTDGSIGALITNPPYGKGGRLAVEFIRHALAVTETRRGKVAMLLRVDFDSANGRRDLFGEHPAFSAKYVLTRRIRWANLEQKASGPTENHAWFVWDWQRRDGARPTLAYLPMSAGAAA